MLFIRKKRTSTDQIPCETSEDELKLCNCCRVNASCINLDAFNGNSYECSVFKEDVHGAGPSDSIQVSPITSKKNGGGSGGDEAKINTMVSQQKLDYGGHRVKKHSTGLSSSKILSLNEFPLQKNIKIVDIVKDNIGEPNSRISEWSSLLAFLLNPNNLR